MPQFRERYDAYAPNGALLQLIAEELSDEDHLEVFLGTWCGDAHREIPRLLKIADQLHATTGRALPLRLILVDPYKTEPAELLRKHDVRNVPTVLVMRGSLELGRIIQRPDGSLEYDLLVALREGRVAYAQR